MNSKEAWCLRVAMFAGAREAAGSDFVQVSVPPNANARELLQALAVAVPQLAGLIRVSRLAMDFEYVDDHTTVRPQSELALIPPVSGG